MVTNHNKDILYGIVFTLFLTAVCRIDSSAQNQNSTISGKSAYVVLKTNLLFDALLIPNIGTELYVGKDFSVGLDWNYAWWSCRERNRYWRIYGGDIYFRWWFGDKARNKPMTGHHLGLYIQAFTYDFEFGGKGQMGGAPGSNMFSRMNFGAGAEYGFSLPVSRRINFDFTIGVGFFGGKYYEYKPVDGHYVWLSTRNRRWFGPTKAEVSLVWLLGRNNVNKKGGKDE